MESLSDPEDLRDRDDVQFQEEAHVVDKEAFEAARETTDSHVAVGVTNDAGEVLLQNDGSHGWTLAAFTVEPGDDWAAAARRGVETLIGIEVDLERPERVRRIEFRQSGDDDRRTTVYNVVFRSTPVTGRPGASRSVDPGTPGGDGRPREGAVELEDDESPVIGWFDEVPADQEGDLADDIRLFVD